MEFIIPNIRVDGLDHGSGNLAVEIDIIDDSEPGSEVFDCFIDILGLEVVSDGDYRPLTDEEEALVRAPESMETIAEYIKGKVTP